jgi:hypothetical protein
LLEPVVEQTHVPEANSHWPCDIFADGVVTMANILLQDLEKLTMSRLPLSLKISRTCTRLAKILEDLTHSINEELYELHYLNIKERVHIMVVMFSIYQR